MLPQLYVESNTETVPKRREVRFCRETRCFIVTAQFRNADTPHFDENGCTNIFTIRLSRFRQPRGYRDLRLPEERASHTGRGSGSIAKLDP